MSKKPADFPAAISRIADHLVYKMLSGMGIYRLSGLEEERQVAILSFVKRLIDIYEEAVWREPTAADLEDDRPVLIAERQMASIFVDRQFEIVAVQSWRSFEKEVADPCVKAGNEMEYRIRDMPRPPPMPDEEVV